MDVKKYFEYSPDLELTVAQIGINKWDWENIKRYDKAYAQRIMSHNRFDILPISIDGKTTHYYRTTNWGNFNTIRIRQIEKSDVIYYRLSFIDLIRKMISEERYHYFLGDSKEILGLISLNNLNCIAVYNYIYQITASMEQLVSSYLKSVFDENEVLEWLKNSSDKQSVKVAEEFMSLQSKNAENSIFHHLYFPSLGTLLKKGETVLQKEKPDLLKYRKKFCSGNLYWEIRNIVSHPVKSLFINETSVNKVHELIADYIEIKNILS